MCNVYLTTIFTRLFVPYTMDVNSELLKDFECILKNNAGKKPLALYSGRKDIEKTRFKTENELNPQDIISNVNKQIRDIQKADAIKSCKRPKENMNKYKTSFLPVNMLPREKEVPIQMPGNKFETQCVSDTQLIDLIDNAEAIANSNNGMTQEFESTFCENVDKIENPTDKNKNVKNTVDKDNTITDTVTIHQSYLINDTDANSNEANEPINKYKDDVDIFSEDFENNYADTQIDVLEKFTESNESALKANDTQVPERNSEIIDKVLQDDMNRQGIVQIVTNIVQNDSNKDGTIQNYMYKEINVQDNTNTQRRSVPDDIISPSPVFEIIRSKTPSPLVFDLTSFENFERIALPIIEENPDMISAKQMINSQIIGKELFIQTNIKCDDSITDDQTSPILKISNEKFKITKPPDRVDVNKGDISLQDKSNDDIFLKDEILFSSDEENEYCIHKELQDIPLTCALETSFYDQPHVLDKTLYVGFQTASNKSIQITSDSFTKAKSVLDEIEKEVAASNTLTDLVVSLCSKDNGYKTLHTDFTGTEPKLNLKNQKKDLEGHNDKIEERECEQSTGTEVASSSRPEKRKLDGFMTASNKKIKLSDIALARCKRVFQDIDLEENFEKESKYNSTKDFDEELEICNNTQIDDDILREFSRDMSLIDAEKIETNEFVTASKKEIKVSEAAIAKTKNIFGDIDASDDLNKESTSKQEFVRFKTASCKDIKVSNAALTKSNQIFQDIIDNLEENISHDILNENNQKPELPVFDGFKTANNKEIKISKQALLKTKDIFKDIEEEIDCKIGPEHNVVKEPTNEYDVGSDIKDLGRVFENEVLDIEKEPPFYGFQTASKKAVQISEKALRDSKNMFSDIKLDDNHNDKIIERPIPAVLKKSYTESCVMKASKEIVENKSLGILPRLSYEKNAKLSFKTANNKPINISNHALEKCKKVFDELDVVVASNNENQKKMKTVNNKGLSKALLKDIYSEVNKSPSIKMVKYTPPAFSGFLTANNKPIGVSSEAVARSVALFKDLDCDDNDSKKTNNGFEISDNNLTVFKRFQTASNEQISVSSEALAKSKASIKDLDKGNHTGNDNCVPNKLDEMLSFKGFQTANNKRISISSEALARSKLLFKDIDNDEEINEVTKDSSKKNTGIFQGFQTANKNPVSVSAEALAKSKMLFKDIDRGIASTDVTKLESTGASFQGFKTANKNLVAVSSEALAKSKAVFKDIDNDENSITKNIDNFKGFHTASNKTVKVSEEALIKSKIILDGIEEYKENEANSNQFKGFQTASNKKVKVSEQALKKTRQIFQDIDLNDENCKDNIVDIDPNIVRTEESHFKKNFDLKTAKGDDVKMCKESLIASKGVFNDFRPNNNNEEKSKANTRVKDVIKPQDNSLERLIDTQIINDFEETLYTEDFCRDTTPRHSKRSGSPILSCPKAKKRKKFETPYRSDGRHSPFIEDPKIIATNKDGVTFNRDYKKNKRLKLDHLAKVEDRNKKITIDPYILNFNLETFLDFEFFGQRNDLNDERLTVEDLKTIFLKVVNKKLIPIGWMENHLKLIIWKLISYEIKFPKTLSGVCSAKNVMEQLKYRFDRELYNAERPALRKIMEKDDVASKSMVLCVAGIYVDGVNVQSVTNISSNVELLLTDGWYLVKANVDKMLTKLVYDEKITVGCKIVTNGAELLNCEQGVAPWEDTSSVRLKIFGNSTRRARWDARLGYHGDAAILSELSAVRVEGGKVSKLRLFVARAYPMLYVEKFEDGSTVTRSERLEHIHQVKCESERQVAMEKLYEEVEKELSDQESQDSFGSQMAAKQRKSSSDFRITESQAKSLEDRSNKKRERLIQNVQERVKSKMEERGLDKGRNIVTLLKVRVAGVSGRDNITVTKGLMSIWKPNDLITEIIKEGSWIKVMNVVPTAIRYSDIHLSAGRHSVFSQSKYHEQVNMRPYIESLKRKCYHIKDLARNPTMTTDYNEVDTVGIIFQIDEETNQPFQNVYLTDSEKNIICVNFWGGLKKFGFLNILGVGQIIYGSNLQKRAGNTRKSIPHFRVTEFTNFTKTPKNVVARSFIDELEKNMSILNKTKYFEECVTVKNNFSKSTTENVSPYRFNNEHNLTKNKVFIDSPLATKCDNLNLTGLDFESTFKQTDTQEMSPKMLQRKRMVKQKIAKLETIGEPPPLSPLNIINKSRVALNHYRSPLAQTIVASTKKNYQSDKDIQTSPVIHVNKLYQIASTVAQTCENTVNCALQPSPIIQNLSKSCQNVASLKQSYQSDRLQFHSSPLQANVDSHINKPHQNHSDKVQPNVASLKRSYQKSRIDTDVISSSPVFSMNRTYVKSVNPVKLNFSNAHDDTLEDVVDHFAEEFDGSPPLSLDSI